MRFSVCLLSAFALTACESGVGQRSADSVKASIARLNAQADSLNVLADSIRHADSLFRVRVSRLLDSARTLQAEANRVGERGNPKKAIALLDRASSINSRAQQLLIAKNGSGVPSRTSPRATTIRNPCDEPRPYRNWSNEELNIAQVEHMGKPESLDLIREAGCRVGDRR